MKEFFAKALVWGSAGLAIVGFFALAIAVKIGIPVLVVLAILDWVGIVDVF